MWFLQSPDRMAYRFIEVLKRKFFRCHREGIVVQLFHQSENKNDVSSITEKKWECCLLGRKEAMGMLSLKPLEKEALRKEL